MRHIIDLSTDQLRMLYCAIPHNQPFEDLKPTVDKIRRLLDIAEQSGE